MKKITFLLLSLIGFSAFAQTVFAPSLDISAVNNGTGAQPYVITSGFINDDALVDVVFSTESDNTIEWYENNGNGDFIFGGLLENGSDLLTIYDLKLIDLNSDGFDDVLATGYGNGTLAWYQNDGTGNFSSAIVIDSNLSGPIALDVGNIDSGTTIDIAVGEYDGSQVIWYANDGSGNFTKSTIFIDDTLNAPGSLQLVDIDNDSDLDALVSTASFSIGSNRAELFINDLVPGGEVEFTKESNPVATSLSYAYSAKQFDLDGDQNLDILLSDLATQIGAGNFYWCESNGSGFNQSEIITSIGNPAEIDFIDLDEDDLMDIVLSEGALTNGNDLVWFKNNGDGTFNPEEIISSDQGQIYSFTVADFDGDGDNDIMSVDYNTNTLWYVENQLETLSVLELESEKFNIYPNPVNERLQFSATDLNYAQLKITDMIGKTVFSDQVYLDEGLDVSRLNNGVYILTVNQNSNFRFIKM